MIFVYFCILYNELYLFFEDFPCFFIYTVSFFFQNYRHIILHTYLYMYIVLAHILTKVNSF